MPTYPTYPGATIGDSPNCWPTVVTPRKYGVIHAFSSSASARETFDWFMNAQAGASTTGIVGKRGDIYQCMNPYFSHWGNCCPTNPDITSWPLHPNANNFTWAVEFEKLPGNLEPLTPEQVKYGFPFIKWLCETCGTPKRAADSSGGIMSHSFLDPVNRPGNFDPGPFPWDDLYNYLKGDGVKLDANGCVVTSPWWYQLSENEMMLCGVVSPTMINFSVLPGTSLTTTGEDIDVATDDIVNTVYHISDPKDFNGVDTWQHDLTDIVNYLKNKYKKILDYKIIATMAQAENAVRSGYPVIFGCNELDLYMWDNDLGWKHPYSWVLSAGHILDFTGIDNMGNWKCPDPLNNAVHVPIYRRASIANSFTGGMIVQLAFLKAIPDVNNWPANFNAQGEVMGLPTGWKTLADGSLQCPTTKAVVRSGFKDRVIGASPQWPGWDEFLENEVHRDVFELNNPAWGGGQQQYHQSGALAWTSSMGVKDEWIGREAYYLRFTLLPGKDKEISDLKALLAEKDKEISDLKAGLGHDPADLAHIATLQASMQSVANSTEGIIEDLDVEITKLREDAQ